MWQPSDDGEENISKQIHSIRPTGKLSNCSVQVHGARPGGNLSVSDMASGLNAIGSTTFENSTDVERYIPKKVKVKNLSIYALRLAGEWNGTGKRDRLDELVIEVSPHGRRR